MHSCCWVNPARVSVTGHTLRTSHTLLFRRYGGDDGDFDYEAVVAPLLVLSSCVCVCVCVRRRRVVCRVVLFLLRACVGDLFLFLQRARATPRLALARLCLYRYPPPPPPGHPPPPPHF